MKPFLVLFLSLTFAVFAQMKKPTPAAPVKPAPVDAAIDSRVAAVTVFARQALVKRTAELNLEAGVHHLVFGRLPAKTRGESIQVGGRGAFTLRDINVLQVSRGNEGEEPDKALSTALAQIETDLEETEDQLTRNKEATEYLGEVAEKLLEKREKEGVAMEIGPENWLKVSKEIQLRRVELDRERREAERRKRRLETEKAGLEQKINDMSGGLQERYPKVELTIEVKSPGRVELELNYLVESAGWGPLYELQVASKERAMTMIYQAQVWQNTGEDWRGVKLVLSTARPDRASQHPNLTPWPVSIVQPAPVRPVELPAASSGIREMQQNITASNMVNASVSGSVKSESGEATAEPPLPEMVLDDAEVEGGATAERYEIAEQTTIASDNQVHKVGIMTRSLPLHFRYSTVPKLAAKAYLKAKAENSTPYTLLPGNARVFLDHNFVTTTQLPRVAKQESFWTFLGEDDDIRVEYRPLKKNNGETGFLKKKNTLEFESLITVTNQKREEVEIVVWDQIPRPQDEEIKVVLQKPEYKGDTERLKLTAANYLEWFHTVKPGEKIEIPFAFVIEYPQDKKISIH